MLKSFGKNRNDRTSPFLSIKFRIQKISGKTSRKEEDMDGKTEEDCGYAKRSQYER